MFELDKFALEKPILEAVIFKYNNAESQKMRDLSKRKSTAQIA